MSRTLDIETTAAAARALLDDRVDAVRDLVRTRQRVSDLREQLAEAERDDVRVYAAALGRGWGADELRKLGITEPEKAARVRKRAGVKPASLSTPPSQSGE